ncbi:MAG: c-type cytochrome [Planctomycetaceae bacterium]|nr:c-type cytochrome [Planctomycetaceae bacterium]
MTQLRNIAMGLVGVVAMTGASQLAYSVTPVEVVNESRERVPATAPADAAHTLRLQNGFRAELIAAEPLVTDPIAMQYDENGLGYVVEMNDYPYSDKSHDASWTEQTSAAIGRIRVLEDTDGDGKFDRSTIFADKLSWPSGIALWKGGLYVAATPDIWYLKDLDGDRRADIRRKVFAGFRKYNVQAVINNLQWGLDHRIYAAGSSNGGNISAVSAIDHQADLNALRRDEQPVRLGRNDFCFDPRSEQFELVSGGARFGHTRDDWGNRFLCNIRNPVQQVVLPAHYLARNAFLPVQSAIHDVARSGDDLAVFQISPAEPWRAIKARRLAANKATKSPYDSTVAKGFVTSCSGVTIYRGAAYPPEFYGNAFIGEVAGNLVMRYQIDATGIGFTAARAHDRVEFLASTDNWFRPVNFINAPDGTLHVLDMCRETIEHPWSMPDDLKAQLDLTSGRDRGRIFRLVPPEYRDGFQEPNPPRLGSATITTLVDELENPNSWWRDTAHRLIFERQDPAAVGPLQKKLRHSSLPVARLHALWALKGLKGLSCEDLKLALADTSPQVREHAVRLSELQLQQKPELLPLILAMVSDDNRRVRFQAALTLGEVQSDQATTALIAIAKQDVADPWSRTAVLSSLSESSVPILLSLLEDTDFVAGKAGRQMIGQLAFGVGARGDWEDLNEVLTALANHRAGIQGAKKAAMQTLVEFEIVSNLGVGLRRTRYDLDQVAIDTTAGGQLVQAMLLAARRSVLSSDHQISNRLQAVEMVGLGDFQAAQKTLLSLLDARQPAELQRAAVRTLTRFSEPDVAKRLLEKYALLTPELQAEVVTRLLTREDWRLAVFDAIESGLVPATRIPEVRRQIYMKSPDLTFRDRAIKLFAAEAPSPREEIIAKYQRALLLSTDEKRGKAVLKRACLNCHRLGDEGGEVGPNLATVQHRSPKELLVSVLDPNREVSPNYMQYLLLMRDGRSLTGLIADETSTSITLRPAEGKTQILLRNEIDEIRNSGISIMPEGIEKDISPQQMADLLAYLLSKRK